MIKVIVTCWLLAAATGLVYWLLVEAGNPDYKSGSEYDRDAELNQPCPDGRKQDSWCGCLPPVYGDDC
jgi:hypothetical protein